MLINTNSNAFKMVRGVAGLAAGLGAATLAGVAMKKLGYTPKNKFQVVTVAVGTFAIGGLVSDTVNRGFKAAIDDYAETINVFADQTKTLKDVKVTVTDTLKV